MGRRHLLAISLGAHLLLGAALGAVPREARHEIIPITMVETKKPKAIHDEPPPPRPDPPTPAPVTHPLRAKAPPRAPKPAPPANAAAPSSLDSLPDFGLSLSGGAAGGLAVPAGGTPGPAPATAPAATRTLVRAAPRADECADPPSKPRLLGHPQAAYPDEARAAGIAGKVRVEISIDEHGRVASVRLLQGLGHGCDEAAMTAARSMTFEPALRCGRAIAATFKISFNFAPSAP